MLPARQEFILLSDTLGLSTLVNTLHDKTAMEEATHTSLLGPFVRENEPGAQICGNDVAQEVVLWGGVINSRGEPIQDAQVTDWQTASDGRYDMQRDPEGVDCRGVFRTDGPFAHCAHVPGPPGRMRTLTSG